MNASGSTGTGLSYDWGFGDGGSGSGFSTNNTYTSAGIYTITLTVTDSIGQTAQQFQNIQVNGPLGPIANFTANPLSGNAPLTVNVDGSASTGSNITYDWDWGDGSAHGSGPTASNTYNNTGPFTITLTVTDNVGQQATHTQNITVNSNGPTASFTANPTSGNAPRAVNVDGSASSGSNITYDWDWEDGSAHGSGPTASNTYNNTGPFTITLTVTDDGGRTATQTKGINVTSAGALAFVLPSKVNGYPAGASSPTTKNSPASFQSPITQAVPFVTLTGNDSTTSCSDDLNGPMSHNGSDTSLWFDSIGDGSSYLPSGRQPQ